MQIAILAGEHGAMPTQRVMVRSRNRTRDERLAIGSQNDQASNQAVQTMMRTVLILATALGFVGSALAADAPTMEQCKAGWKSDYSKMWTQDQFTKACDAMMKSGGNM